LRKFFGLIINEYVKIFCKASTKIMMAVIVLVALGYNFIMYIGTSSESDFYYNAMGPEYYIENAKTQKYDGWERDLAMYTYYLENDIEYIEYYSVSEPKPDEWRSEAIQSMFWLKYDTLKEAETNGEKNKVDAINLYVDELDKAIKSKDWKAYYKAELAYLEKITGSGEREIQEYDIKAWQLKYKTDNDVAPDDWRYMLINDIAGYRYTLLDYTDVTEIDENYAIKIDNQNKLVIAEYRLENDIKEYTYNGIESIYQNSSLVPGFWDIFGMSIMTISVISVLIIIIAGSLISSEFSSGTVKFLLINPVKRWKIFVAKYISVISITLVSLLVLYIFNFIFAGIFFGFNSIASPFLSAENGNLIVGSSIGYIAVKYLLDSIGMVCMATFAFMLSSLVRNSALAIGLGVFLFLTGENVIVNILTMLGIYQAKYILFANTSLNSVINGDTPFVNHTLSFALINIAVYMVVFILTAWDGFVRNDIK